MQQLPKFLLLIALFLAQMAFAGVNIEDVRFANFSQQTRLVFDLSGRPKYLLFSLTNPDRLLVDIKNASLTKDFSKFSLQKNSLIKNLRIRIEKNYVRFILQLSNPIVTKTFVLPENRRKKYRLVIDLHEAKILKELSLPKTKLLLPIPTLHKPVALKAAVTTPITINYKFGAMQPVPPVRGRNIIVVIDPGHGGKDPGTTSFDGVHEKNIVLAIAKYLQQYINQQQGFHAVLTRTSDYYIPLRGRLDIARQDKADIFISIHADAFPSSNEMGASVFALSERGATSEAAKWLAEKENNSELLGGASLPDNDNVLRSVLIDLSQNNTISESLQIGSTLLRHLGRVTFLHHQRVEQAAFVVLKSPDIPSVLVETGFLSTPTQERQLTNANYQKNIAKALSAGIMEFFLRNPPQDTLIAIQHAVK